MDWQYLSLGDLEQNEIFPKSRDSEMVFSTFLMRYFSKKNSTWIRCKMAGTSSAYSMYLIVQPKHSSSRKVGEGGNKAPQAPPDPPSL